MHTLLRRALTSGGVVLLGLTVAVGGAGAASAHVTVDPSEAEAGGYALLTFRVPNESDTASTTELEVDLPTDTPFAHVSVEPVPGWTATVTTAELDEPVSVHGAEITEAVDTVTWTADDADAAIAPGEFRRFTVSAGPVPEVESIVLPAHQTYSDGEVVSWEEVAEGDAEPSLPAPVLAVTSAQESAQVSAQTSAQTSAEGSGGGDATGLWLGAAGLGLGLVGAVTGAVALSRTRTAGTSR
ncbi:YcnI family protein [Isoptericola sp. S6320L]|uniref:YcnI family copper-binding membrane protein n=1 Tax=Isoptericola sp. S6320L TaxID=2926411 RepID=UPI001FF49271|nr:YcnI family protein [Isoptericola sp. S6320L]MCK0117202.1 YcnI family protein [Isoptericola sp. S6320L]